MTRLAIICRIATLLHCALASSIAQPHNINAGHAGHAGRAGVVSIALETPLRSSESRPWGDAAQPMGWRGAQRAAQLTPSEISPSSPQSAESSAPRLSVSTLLQPQPEPAGHQQASYSTFVPAPASANQAAHVFTDAYNGYDIPEMDLQEVANACSAYQAIDNGDASGQFAFRRKTPSPVFYCYTVTDAVDVTPTVVCTNTNNNFGIYSA
ncbi:uncharacterized protein MKK02DRAFT_30586 [Dioszegia hungarica]|uniref:Uncharacterized protein n=1 Tax=Dioszegia hungarica TaxID=4972 RepID=A0AA38H5F7_9TREE|nr:uncharacterized protein MKK02DRAFT_30586 [Dioszegia hungarica]KAI9632859.1 hypothetical protein MKK02DRAFT_30586 [Dioszegia hungarica]